MVINCSVCLYGLRELIPAVTVVHGFACCEVHYFQIMEDGKDSFPTLVARLMKSREPKKGNAIE